MRQVLNRSRQRGAALVEMAMVLPIVAFLFMGVVQFGMDLREHQIVRNAAREGARVAMLPQYQTSVANPTGSENQTQASTRVAQSIREIVLQYLNNENISLTSTACSDISAVRTKYQCGDITIDQDVSYAAGSITVKASIVTVSYSKAPILGASLFGNITYKGESIF